MTKDKIRIFDLKYDDDFKKKFQAASALILDRAFLTNDLYVQKFEENFSEFNKCNYTVAVNNGTSALEMALRAVDVRDKIVVIPTNTFIATATAVLNSGGIPYLVDIEDRYYGICPIALKKVLAVTNSDLRPKACIAVHIGGHVSDQFLEIKSICEEFGVELIEDCAHGVGAKLSGELAGNFGRFGCFSFFTTKNIAMGEGGAIICKNEADYHLLQSVRQFGKDSNNPISHSNHGSNFKLSEFSALLGVLDLERAPGRIQRRREIAQIYRNNLDVNLYHVVSDSDESIGSYYKQVVLSKSYSRDEVLSHCLKNDIQITGGVYYIPIHEQPFFKDKYKHQQFPVADYFCNNHFCPPCYPELTDSQVIRVCNVLNGI